MDRLVITRPKAQLANHPDNEHQAPRRPRLDRNYIYRHSFIQYAYAIHYFLYCLFLTVLWQFGVYQKGDSTLSKFMHIKVPDTSCSPVVEAWNMAYVFFCPLVVLVSSLIYYRAKRDFIISTYTLDTQNKYFEI